MRIGGSAIAMEDVDSFLITMSSWGNEKSTILHGFVLLHFCIDSTILRRITIKCPTIVHDSCNRLQMQ